ncbi:hypothetical protein ABGB17_05060 [Sphaerisporangium sp. B11E5]|uniref:hypothetical protein n=1 Tax=Sphaerisporangium sp. B11E5 TaxID=3153563 RepID=UPI00325E7754
MADKVRTAVQVALRRIEIGEFPRLVIGPDEGLLRVEADRVCGSDVEVHRGYHRVADGDRWCPATSRSASSRKWANAPAAR